MNAHLRKELALHVVGSVDTILGQYAPKIGINEGDNKYFIKTIPSPTQKPYYGKNTDITIPLTDSNVDVVEFNKSYFTLNLDIQLDFDPGFPVLPLEGKEWMTTLNPLLNPTAEGGTAWTENPVCVNLAKMTYFFIGFKNSTDCIASYRIAHNNLDIGETQTATAQ
jgi:hypothetical protein